MFENVLQMTPRIICTHIECVVECSIEEDSIYSSYWNEFVSIITGGTYCISMLSPHRFKVLRQCSYISIKCIKVYSKNELHIYKEICIICTKMISEIKFYQVHSLFLHIRLGNHRCSSLEDLYNLLHFDMGCSRIHLFL